MDSTLPARAEVEKQERKRQTESNGVWGAWKGGMQACMQITDSTPPARAEVDEHERKR